ncbi:MAG: HAD family phosphatase [Calditrichaeota bacterium]|nr:MAG: HAD family phosphatase [Calditrichota bacterium]
MYKAVLFDFDGVILQSMQTHARLWQEILLQEYDLKITTRDVFLEEGRTTDAVADILFKKYNRAISSADSHIIAEKKQSLYLDAAKPGIYPEIADILAFLKSKKIATAVVTGTRRANIDRAIPPDLRGLFDEFVTAEKYEKGKPDPEPFLNGAKLLGVNPQDCIVVENAPLGVQAAKAAGTHVIAICTTLGSDDLTEADEIVPDFERLFLRLKKYLS